MFACARYVFHQGWRVAFIGIGSLSVLVGIFAALVSELVLTMDVCQTPSARPAQ